MSAYEDPIKYYATKVNYTDAPKVTEDQGRYTDPFMNKMFENRDYYKMNEIPAELLMPKQDINKGVMTPKDLQFQKTFDNQKLEARDTRIDPYALLTGTQETLQNLGKTKYGTFGVQDILSSPTFTYEKEIGPGTLSGKIGDNKASLGYSMIFNKGGRVRGTGIMGAL